MDRYRTIETCDAYMGHQKEVNDQAREERREINHRMYDMQKVIYDANGIRRKPKPPRDGKKPPAVSIPMPGSDRNIEFNLGPVATMIIGGAIALFIIALGVKALFFP